MKKLEITFSALLLTILSGCSVQRASNPDMDYYYRNPNKDFSAIGRVVVVELNNSSNYPQVEKNITKLLFQALQKKQLFGLSIVYQDDPRWRSLGLNTDSSYTLEEYFDMRKTLKCDAVLLGTITEYQPYPRMVIGLRLKLIDLRDGETLWALEQIWDSSDKKTEKRIKSYLKTQTRTGSKSVNEQLMMFSLRRFTKFLVYEAAETLKNKR